MPKTDLTSNFVVKHIKQHLQIFRLHIFALGVLVTILFVVSCVPTTGEIDTAVPTRPFIPIEKTDLPLSWPLPLPSIEQIDEAHACDLENEANKRYPDNVEVADLRDHYLVDVESPCDWAILAAAYADRVESDAKGLEEGRLAWANAVSQNPSYAFVEALFFGYMEAEDAVAAPPITLSSLTQIEIHYEWSGLGELVEFDITVTNSDMNPKVAGLVNGESITADLEVDTAQALGNALTGLLPVTNQTSMVVCFDNYPDWFITLTYQDGSNITLTTNGSNVYHMGGPWWVEIDDNLYLQNSATILTALDGIIDELELPLGQPAAMFCPGFESSIMDMLFSD